MLMKFWYSPHQQTLSYHTPRGTCREPYFPIFPYFSPNVGSFLVHLVKQGEANGSGSSSDVVYRGQVVVRDCRVLRQELDQRWHQKHCVRTMLGQDLQEHPWVKTGHDDLGGPVAKAVGHDDVEPPNVEEGEEEKGGGVVLHEPVEDYVLRFGSLWVFFKILFSVKVTLQ